MQTQTISQMARQRRNERIIVMYYKLLGEIESKEMIYAKIARTVGVSVLTVRNVVKATAQEGGEA